MHNEPHPQAGQVVRIKLAGTDEELDYRLEDWWDRVGSTGSWMNAAGNPACLQYATRIPGTLPIDDEVVYGKIGALGYLVHKSEIITPCSPPTSKP